MVEVACPLQNLGLQEGLGRLASDHWGSSFSYGGVNMPSTCGKWTPQIGGSYQVMAVGGGEDAVPDKPTFHTVPSANKNTGVW
jgi:hypothetical protein